MALVTRFTRVVFNSSRPDLEGRFGTVKALAFDSDSGELLLTISLHHESGAPDDRPGALVFAFAHQIEVSDSAFDSLRFLQVCGWEVEL